MKKPSLSLNPAAVGGFFISHGEKIAVAIVGLFSLILIWWGIDAFRSESVRLEKMPEAIRNLAKAAKDNVERVTRVPAERLPEWQPITPLIDPWRPQDVKIAAAPSSRGLLDRPLFAELTKRSVPEVFPIESLRAVAGIAVLPDPNADVNQQGGAMVAPRQPDFAPPPPENPRRCTQSRRQREQAGERPPFGFEGGLGMEDLVESSAQPQQPGKITPFVVVTGLVPAARQLEEYDRRFGSASFQDPRRDSPRWAVYLVERARVVPGGTPRWEKQKIKDVVRSDPGAERIGIVEMQRGGAPGMQPMDQEALPQAFFLQPEETEIGYAASLPQRIDEPWAAAVVHPWFIPRIEEFLNGEKKAQEDAGAVAVIALADLAANPRKYLGGEIRLEGVSLYPDPERQRSVSLYRFGVRSAEGKNAIGIQDIGQTDKPVFAVSEQWGRQLSVDGTADSPQPCNLRVRIDMIGKTPVVRILAMEVVDEAGDVGEPRTDPSPEPVAGIEGGEGAMPEGARGGFGPAIPLAENRLFRFVDTDVKPGETYRYRVKFALRNPNVNLAPQHLADVAAAKGEFLVSAFSNETDPVRVPDPTRLVVRTIDRDTMRKMRINGDALEVMVLAPSEKTGNFALRSTITDIGGLANVDM